MAYVKSDYVSPNYTENDNVIIPEPTDNIVSINRSFILDGIDITSYITEAEIIRENGKAYTTLACSTFDYIIAEDLIRNPNKRLTVTIGVD